MRGITNIFSCKWFYIGYYKYLFSDLEWCTKLQEPWYWKLKVIWCRMREHPSGVVWFTNAMEPDRSCRNCGDET